MLNRRDIGVFFDLSLMICFLKVDVEGCNRFLIFPRVQISLFILFKSIG